MLITTGKVRHGTVEVETKDLPEGATVTVLAVEGNETFELQPAEEAVLLAAIKEAEQGETVPASQVLQQIRDS